MKDKLFIDDASAYALDKWRVENAGFVLAAPLYFKEFEVIWPSDKNGNRKTEFHAYVHEKADHIKIEIKDDRSIIFWIKLFHGDDKHDFYMKVRERKTYIGDRETMKTLAQEFCLEILSANAFLTYGNIFEKRYITLRSRNEDEKKVIVFREMNGEVYAAEARAHRSPEGVFSVRGHFRRYKSGKIIWIDEYLKGVEK